MTTHYSQQEKTMVDWAAPTLIRLGCTLHSVADGWDVETPDGAWLAANSARDLANIASELLDRPKTHITVTRTQVYPSVAHPGPAWKYVYTVAIPGEPYTFSGEGINWVKRLCRSKRPDLKVVYAWEVK